MVPETEGSLWFLNRTANQTPINWKQGNQSEHRDCSTTVNIAVETVPYFSYKLPSFLGVIVGYGSIYKKEGRSEIVQMLEQQQKNTSAWRTISNSPVWPQSLKKLESDSVLYGWRMKTRKKLRKLHAS